MSTVRVALKITHKLQTEELSNTCAAVDISLSSPGGSVVTWVAGTVSYWQVHFYVNLAADSEEVRHVCTGVSMPLCHLLCVSCVAVDMSIRR
jgi:hypothetical protein